MNFEAIYQTTLGLSILYLFFISWLFDVKTFIAFLVLKVFPFIMACVITFGALIDAGYIMKVQ